MRRVLVIIISLSVAALVAGAFYAHVDRQRAAYVDQLTWVWESDCDAEPGVHVERRCLIEVPMTRALAGRPELARLLVGDRIGVVDISPLTRPIAKGDLFTDLHFDQGHRPVPDGMRAMTIAVEADRVPGGVDPGAHIDVYSPPLNVGETGRLVLGDLEVVEVNGRRYSHDGETRSVERITLMVPDETSHLLADNSRRLVVSLRRQAPGSVGLRR